MARTFHEAELMMQAARKHPNIVTQVGNQGHSEANYFQFKTWVEAGIIKDVTAVTAHMNNSRRWHKWDTNIYKLPEQEAIPNGLDWMTWLSAVPYHEYNKNTITENGVAGMTSVWELSEIGELIFWIPYTSFSN